MSNSSHCYNRTNIWSKADQTEIDSIFNISETYKTFLDEVRTERQGVVWLKSRAEELGFKDITQMTTVMPGDKVYFEYAKKNISLAVIGKSSIKNGVNIVGAHLDAPRLDLKIHPIVEDTGIAMLKTHYYGGIKKYQWLNIPLALHGVVVRADGTQFEVNIGDNPADPVFVISDLLPHLSRKIQGDKKLLDGIEGENLTLMAGTIPLEKAEHTEKVKANVLQILYDRYQIVEEDLISAEIQVVPALKTRDAGLDRSMIAGYAHDDRVCSFGAFQAIINISDIPERTCIVFLTDKEEIGSKGITGADSCALPNLIAELLYREDSSYRDIELRRALNRSFCLSADVGAAYNPLYASVHDKFNAAYMNSGVIIKKYTGAGGKSNASDASAELVGKVRKIFNDNNVVWQASSMGKVDEGGGGTIAMFIAQFGIPVLDSGIGVVGMHSPYEIISKADLYHMIKGYHAFFLNA
ncbi:MAG: aminopeptidase [Brevinemataceae bacterium]